MWRYLFSSILGLGFLGAFGQPADSLVLKPKTDWRPHEMKVGINAIRTGRSAFLPGLVTHEVQGMLSMHQLNLVVDLGLENNRFGSGYHYENKGTYYRFGGDWNFVKDKWNGNVVSLGLRYARAAFSDTLNYTNNQGFGETNFDFKNSNLKARWFEVTFNIRGKVISNLYIGFTTRWQLMRKIRGEQSLRTFNVSGFGNTKRRNSTAFDYYLMWRIPFRKKGEE